MRVVGEYSFNRGAEYIKEHYPQLLQEVYEVIAGVDAKAHKTKDSKEATRKYARLYSPPALNRAFKLLFTQRGWHHLPIKCEYPTQYYVNGYSPNKRLVGTRDMDFVKQKLGVEIQFGKYSFMVYNVAAKMTIFRNMGYINAGIEVVPVKELVREMSTGVSFFEQFIWDLEYRGVANIDVPVLVLGIADEETYERQNDAIRPQDMFTPPQVEEDDPSQYEE